MLDKLLGWLFGRRTPAVASSESEATASAPTPAAAPKIPPKPPTMAAASPMPFLPITRSDLAKQAAEIQRTTGWMWFGRRDLIPPISDPRTLLIDRGLVTQGFFTPAELTEMHAVGDEHAKYAHREEFMRNEAAKTAELALVALKAVRAAKKAAKKAEAAARRERRAGEIAARKANDIVFVGRGVSGRMHLRESDAGRLAAHGLPVMSTPADLAAALGLPPSKLRWLCFHSEAATRIHYVQFRVPKKSGGERTLSAPHRTLAAAQRWILENVLAKLAPHPAAHGFVAGRSILTNAAPHAGRAVVVNVDLEDFFPSIGFFRVRRLFATVGYSWAVATLLALLTTECPRKEVTYDGKRYYAALGPRGLPQGACTSPAISNLIARRLDRRLTGFAAKLGLTYTRYADDLTVSGDAELASREAGPSKIGYLLACIRHIAEDSGFRINPKKTRVLRAHERQTVTGLVVNRAPAVPRRTIRKLRAILHRAASEGLAAQNRQGHPRFRAWVEGMIAFVGMTKPEVAARFESELGNAKP